MISTWFAALAVLSPIVVGFGVAYLTNRWGRERAREVERIKNQAWAYKQLAAHAVRLRQYALVANPDLKDTDPWLPPQLDIEELYEMFAWVELYGSDAVLKAYEDLLTLAARTRGNIAGLADILERKPFDPDTIDGLTLIEEEGMYYESLQCNRKELRALCDDVLKLVRGELRSVRSGT